MSRLTRVVPTELNTQHAWGGAIDALLQKCPSWLHVCRSACVQFSIDMMSRCSSKAHVKAAHNKTAVRLELA